MSLPSRRVAIVGGGVGGLSAAIHAARHGFQVTIYEKNETVGGRANRLALEGFRFDTGPSLLNYPWVFEDLFQAAGACLSDYVTLLPVEPGMHFIWPDGERLTLSSDLPLLAGELERFEDRAHSRLMAWLADGEERFDLVMRRMALVNATGVLDYVRSAGVRNLLRAGFLGSMHGSLARFFRSRYVRDALGAYAMYLGGSPWSLPAAFAVLPYGEIADGLWLPAGGMYALVTAMATLASELGVCIKTKSPVRRVETDGRAVTGVVLEDGTREACDAVILNADAPAARENLLPEVGRSPKKPEMTPSVLTLYLGLRRPISGLGHHTVFMPGDTRQVFTELMTGRAIPRDLPFYVAVPSATDPSLAPDGQAAVFILVPLPLPARFSDWARADIAAWAREQVRERLRRHALDWTDEDVQVEVAWTPRDWGGRFGLYQDSAFGAAHIRSQIGPWRWPNRDPYVQGLYYTGASTVPGTGLPTVTLSGKMTVGKLLSDVQ